MNIPVSQSRPPSVSRVLETETGRKMVANFGHGSAVNAIRAAIVSARENGTSILAADIAGAAAGHLSADELSPLRPLWNCTGTILHTNLGRALLSENATAAATAAMKRPVALEYDLGTGARGRRDDAVSGLIEELTGAEASLLVNNNAAALMLVLATFASAGDSASEVIVSRGELIEIGGAFRLPEIMEAAGVRLKEVGTTNRTHLRDYENAIGVNTRLILKVHTSNYRVEGFTAEVAAPELAKLCGQYSIPLVNDLGSGILEDIAQFGLPKEPTVAEALAEGADIVTFSGDKLLGGPQAGFAIGRADLIAKMNRHPMKRAMRLDKIRLAALEATLRDFRRGIASPTWAAISRDLVELNEAAVRIADQLSAGLSDGFTIDIAESRSQIGSGAAPTARLPSVALAITPLDTSLSLDALAEQFRRGREPIIGRIRNGRLLLDLRSIAPSDEADFIAALHHQLSGVTT